MYLISLQEEVKALEAEYDRMMQSQPDPTEEDLSLEGVRNADLRDLQFLRTEIEELCGNEYVEVRARMQM
jgi:cell division protein FtsB